MQFDCITKLIDLPDVRVIDFVSNEKNLVLIAEHIKEFVTCPDCGEKLTKALDRRTKWVKDSPILGKRTLIRLEKRDTTAAVLELKKLTQNSIVP